MGGKAGSKALVGGLLSKLKAGALAESRGEENPGMVKMSLPPVEAANKVSTEKPASLALGVGGLGGFLRMSTRLRVEMIWWK